MPRNGRVRHVVAAREAIIPVCRRWSRTLKPLTSVSLAASLAVLLAGCGGGPDPQAEALAFRNADDATLSVGADRFAAHCAACHGAERQGAPEWWKRDADGRTRPPALDGTAHAWHHPVWQLRDTIRYGSAAGPAGTDAERGFMPGFGDQLSDAEIDALIAYIVTNWPEAVFTAWLDYQRRDPTREDWERRTGERWITPDRE